MYVHAMPKSEVRTLQRSECTLDCMETYMELQGAIHLVISLFYKNYFFFTLCGRIKPSLGCCYKYFVYRSNLKLCKYTKNTE